MSASPYAHDPAAGPTEASAWGFRRVLATNLRAVTGRAYPARPRQPPREVVDLLRDRPAVPVDLRLRPRLPGTPGAGGVCRLRRPGRGHDRVLAQRAVGHGRPALLGSRRGQPGDLLHGPDQPDEHPRRDGRRGSLHDRDPGPGDHRHGIGPLRGPVRHRPVAPAGRRLPAHPRRPLRAGDADGQPLPLLGPRGMAPGQPLPGADLLPWRPVRAGEGPGPARRARDRPPAPGGRAGRHPPAHVHPGPGHRVPAAARRGGDPRRDVRRLPPPGPGCAAPTSSGGPAPRAA